MQTNTYFFLSSNGSSDNIFLENKYRLHVFYWGTWHVTCFSLYSDHDSIKKIWASGFFFYFEIKHPKYFDRLIYDPKQPRNHLKPQNQLETKTKIHGSKYAITTKVKGKKPIFKRNLLTLKSIFLCGCNQFQLMLSISSTRIFFSYISN